LYEWDEDKNYLTVTAYKFVICGLYSVVTEDSISVGSYAEYTGKHLSTFRVIFVPYSSG